MKHTHTTRSAVGRTSRPGQDPFRNPDISVSRPASSTRKDSVTDIARDEKFFVGWYDPDGDRGVADLAGVVAGVGIRVVIYGDAEVAQPAADLLADRGGV